MDRSDVLTSPAYQTLSPSSKRVLHLIIGETERNGGEPVSLSHDWFEAKMARGSSIKAVKQLRALGFVTVETGKRGTNTFAFCDGWREVNAEEAQRRVALARLPTPQRPAAPKPVKAPKPEPLARPHVRVQRGVPSLPRFSWQDDGR
jgi:hypothetical protein